MRHSSTHILTRSIVCSAIAALTFATQALADGTGALGVPSIPIAEGSYIHIEGTGLDATQPGEIVVQLANDVTVEQVLLYWAGRTNGEDHGVDDTIQVNTEDVTGMRIGGPTANSFPCFAYRADITSKDWVMAGSSNVLSVGGLNFSADNDGAAVVIILNDGTTNMLGIVDGSDYAFEPEGLQTTPIDYSFAASSETRMGHLQLIVSDVEAPRPAGVQVTVNGVTNLWNDVLTNNKGDHLDVVTLEIELPPGTTNITVQVLSIDDETNLLPASLNWIFGSLTIENPPEVPPGGCTYTIGFWKNHPYDWPTEELSLWSKYDAMMALWSPPKGGNAYLILAHQYIAAELNVVNGASIPEDVLDAWLDAQELLEAYMGAGTIPKKSDDRDIAINLALMLDRYNNGEIGPGHCD